MFFSAGGAPCAQERQDGDNGLDGGEGSPHAADAGKRRQRQQDGRDDDHPAHQRNGKALRRAPGRAEKRGGDDVEARAPEAEEIDPQAGYCIACQHRVARTVECRGNRGGKGEHRRKQHGRDRQRRDDPVAVQAAQRAGFARAAAVADQRLDAGGQAGENRNGDQCKVGDNAIGSNAGVPGEAQQHLVEQQQYDARRQLGDQRGQAGGAERGQEPQAGLCAQQMEAAAGRAQMAGQDEHADNRGDTGRKRRAEHAHAEREDENIIHHDIGQAADNHAAHRAARAAVVPDKSEQHVIHDEERAETEQRAQVYAGQREGFGVRTEQTGERAGRKHAQQQEKQPHGKAKPYGMRKCAVCFFLLVLRAADGEMRGAAHADHQADAVHQVVERQRDVERGQSGCARAARDEKGIRQDIAGDTDLPQDTRRSVFPESPKAHSLFQFDQSSSK